MLLEWLKNRNINFSFRFQSILTGLYLASNLFNIFFVSPPVDHWCAPPSDLVNSENMSAYKWRNFDIPFSDQLNDRVNGEQKFHRFSPENIWLSQCYQFDCTTQNGSNGEKIITISYNTSDEVSCKSEMYFVYPKMSLISQVQSLSLSLI